MGLTGVLKEIALKKCGHCEKPYGKHSKKGFMKCLYTSNYNLYNAVMEIQELKTRVNVLEKKPELTEAQFPDVKLDQLVIDNESKEE